MRLIRIIFISFCIITLLSSCAKITDNKDSDNEQNAISENGSVLYVGNSSTVFSEDYALYVSNTTINPQLRIFDRETKTTIPYCFRPECEHKPPTYDMGIITDEGCQSYHYSNYAHYIAEDYIYYLNYPYLYRNDRNGDNQKIVCKIDAPQPVIFSVFYSQESAFVVFCYYDEYEEIEDINGKITWLPIRKKENPEWEIMCISLQDGSTQNISPVSERFGGYLVSFRVVEDGIIYYWIEYDENPDVLSDIDSSEDKAKWMARHRWEIIYHFSCNDKKTDRIIEAQGNTEYSFINGFIVAIDEGRVSLLDMKGNRVRELSDSINSIVPSDRNLLGTIGNIEQNITYCLYDIESDKIIRQVELPSEKKVFLIAAVGNSYYGIDPRTTNAGGHPYFWIDADAFWTGRMENMVYIE